MAQKLAEMGAHVDPSFFKPGGESAIISNVLWPCAVRRLKARKLLAAACPLVMRNMCTEAGLYVPSLARLRGPEFALSR